MRPSLIIYGPQGCGKTTHAEELRQYFGLANIIEADGTTGDLPAVDALILTSTRPDTLKAFPARVLSFDEAMDQLQEARRNATAAPAILRDAAQAIDDRATLRDCPDGERSMARCVAAFNALTGHTLSETEGWHFMSFLKLARATAGGHHLDDHTDHAAYAALAGEAAEREAQQA